MFITDKPSIFENPKSKGLKNNNYKLSTLTIAMLMVQKSIDGAVIYEAPVMISAEVSVENGFAASDGTATFGIDNFEEGIEF